MPTHSVLALTPAAPTACNLPPGIPMDVDAAQQLCTVLLLCQRSEQEELLLQLLATKDAAGALLLDKPMLELTPEEASMCTSPPELEEDF
ncbi:hypothetical protein C0989_000510 [Termitomyces sp. Mn162]|nr:hypothetical protein C0989_000510 [Termitomyces sp. Mn162]